MNRLLEIGFEQAGHWLVANGKILFDLSRHSTQKNILYAFTCDAEVMYVGKTVKTLATRMSGYKSPGKTQTTNINNNRKILEALISGAAIQIFALPDNGLLHYGRFHLNLAAGLEDDIIRKIDPPWNGGKVEKPAEVELDIADSTNEPTPPVAAMFQFVLQPTYFRSGFFNVAVSCQKHIGGDGETIELFLGDANQPVLGTINRRANTNGTPRIMGGAPVRNWFHSQAKEMNRINVQVHSPTSIRLDVANA